MDLLAFNTTMTLSRDAAGGNGLSFAPTTFNDGQGLMAPAASGVGGLKDLAGQMLEQGIAYTPLKFQNMAQMVAAYLSGRCVAVSTEPLTPASINADPVWADAVRWIIFGLIQA
ncbi:MAG: hypothetical protein R6W06_13850 [Prochlorococcaceae cyanobacterium]